MERGTREAKEYPVRRGVRYNGLWLNKPGINDEIKKSNDAGNATGIVMPCFLFYSQNRVPASKTQPICSLEKILSKKHAENHETLNTARNEVEKFYYENCH